METLNKMYFTLESLEIQIGILQRHMVANPNAEDMKYCKEQLKVLDDYMQHIQEGIEQCISSQEETGE
jgi:thymidylate kinase